MVRCALTFTSEAKFEIEEKTWFHMIHFDAKHQKSQAKTKVKQAKIKRKNRSVITRNFLDFLRTYA